MNGAVFRSAHPRRSDVLVLFAIIAIAVVAAFPLLWMVLSSLKTPAETMQTPPVWFPAAPNLSAYGEVAGVIDARRSFLNSFIIATTTTAGILVTSLMAGYAFAKYRFRGRDLLFAVMIATMFLPPIVTLIPLYRLVTSMGMGASLFGVIAPHLANAFGIFLMRQFIAGVPDDLIDGYDDVEAGLYVVRDLTQPGPYAVTEVLYSGGSFLGQNTFYPSNIAELGELPLIVVSHGNGHNYQWYDHIGNHMASYGYVVMSHQNNTVPGVDSAATTTLTNTEYFLGNLDIIQGGVLQGHVDSHHITWIGHSRGGEGVAIAYDRLFDGVTVPVNYSIEDIVLVSSIAPTGFNGMGSTNTHDANTHVWVGAADADVNGCTSSNVTQSFHISDRATNQRQTITLYGAGHGDFHNSSGSVASGPCLIGKSNAHAIMRGYLLPLVAHRVYGDLAAEEFLWRQWESFKPIGAPLDPCVVVDLTYHQGSEEGAFVIDDFQRNPGITASSSFGAVTATVSDLEEGVLDDPDVNFTADGDSFNGMTFGRPTDTTRGAVFEYTGDALLSFEVTGAGRNAQAFDFLSFRACQSTRDPLTTAELGDTTFTVELEDGSGTTSAIQIGVYGGGIEEPYQRTSCGTGAGWNNEFETVRVRLSDFPRDGSGLDLSDLAAVTFRFGPSWGTAQGRLGLDDLELISE